MIWVLTLVTDGSYLSKKLIENWFLPVWTKFRDTIASYNLHMIFIGDS